MSRRKDRGETISADIGKGVLLAIVCAIVLAISAYFWNRHTDKQAPATPTPAATTPAPTQPDTQPEATNPTEKSKGEAPKLPPDGAPSNPLFLAWSELEGGVPSGDAEAVVKKYGAYAHLQDPFVSHGEWGDTYIWTWESQEKDWRMRLQYSESEARHPGMGIIGIFYTQEHITYRKTLSK